MKLDRCIKLATLGDNREPIEDPKRSNISFNTFLTEKVAEPSDIIVPNGFLDEYKKDPNLKKLLPDFKRIEDGFAHTTADPTRDNASRMAFNLVGTENAIKRLAPQRFIRTYMKADNGIFRGVDVELLQKIFAQETKNLLTGKTKKIKATDLSFLITSLKMGMLAKQTARDSHMAKPMYTDKDPFKRLDDNIMVKRVYKNGNVKLIDSKIEAADYLAWAIAKNFINKYKSTAVRPKGKVNISGGDVKADVKTTMDDVDDDTTPIDNSAQDYMAEFGK